MPCYICKGKSQYYQRLDRSRARFMRKVYTDFSDSSYLCMRCFEKFEKIFKSKKKSKHGTSNISIASNVTLRTVSSKSSSTSKEAQPTKDVSSKENTQSNGSPPLVFLSHSFQAASDSTNDSTDNLVHRTSEIPSLRDSSKVTRNPDIAVAREGAQAAERSALRRKRTREVDLPQTPISRRQLPIVDEDSSEDTEISSMLEPNDIAHVRPIVKKRKEPVVHFNQDIMDIYLANTSGG